jgi:amino-acid N-acetyltransferase
MTRPTSPIVRSARPDDLPAVLALLAEASLPTVGVAEAFEHFIVAEQGASIIAAIGLEACGDRHALLRSAVVASEARGHGVGRALMARAIAAAESSGIDALYLLTTTAEAYFPKFGFARIEREEAPNAIQVTEEFASACPASAAVMVRLIG